MANRQRGEVTQTIGKQKLTFALTTNAVCEFEDFSPSRTWEQVLTGINDGRMKDVRLFFWVALRDRHPEIATDDPASLKEIGKLIDAGGTKVMSKLLTTLLTLNTDGDKVEDGEGEVPKTAARPLDAQAGTGDGSLPTH